MRSSFVLDNPSHMDFQDPVAAKTWGREEATVPGHMGGAEWNPCPGVSAIMAADSQDVRPPCRMDCEARQR